MAFDQVPREIRQRIFELVIGSPVDPPACPSVSQEGRKRLLGSGIWQLPPQNPALPLLLLNKQSHDEVKYVLQRVPTDYHVDVMLVKDCGLWTTWSIPVLPRTQYIDSVSATFRIFEPTNDLDARFRGSLKFYGGCGGPPTASWSFHRLVTALVTDGPGYSGPELASQWERHDLKPRYVIKHLKIDILAPTDGAAHTSVVQPEQAWAAENKRGYDGRLTRWDHHDDASMPPEERVAGYMGGELDHLFDISYYTMRYGVILWEGFAKDVVLLVNGTEHKRIDVEELVQNHKIKYWGNTPESVIARKQRYGVWRAWLDERRRRMKDDLELDDNRPVGNIMN
ncbi:hypothetical protein B0J13DRAFT_557411 [Dactylonectria estremocensis]|uniref:Uncharacterized protein n=1 Tax=Dactylonectria estremocensis TaxID=1079267 RepID=A0A9P9ENB8_9HYPO|nr:hypothetical protein B0J13DRAFT_557411 [Dactylonectria estremocensis]